MKPFLDKATGLWKWGTRGEPKYKTADEAKRTETARIEEMLRRLKKKCEEIYGTIGT